VREPVIVLNFFGNCACACHEKINKSRPKVIKYDSRPSNKILLIFYPFHVLNIMFHGSEN
jgi:hypothetical protein